MELLVMVDRTSYRSTGGSTYRETHTYIGIRSVWYYSCLTSADARVPTLQVTRVYACTHWALVEKSKYRGDKVEMSLNLVPRARLVNFSPRVAALFARVEGVYCPQLETRENCRLYTLFTWMCKKRRKRMQPWLPHSHFNDFDLTSAPKPRAPLERREFCLEQNSWSNIRFVKRSKRKH